MEDSLGEIRRQITSGLLHLTAVEEEAVQSLVDIFPQNSQWSLSSVVVLHNRHFQSAADQLVACCVSFLFSDDSISLADFLHPVSGTDSDLPQIVTSSRSEISSFTAGVSSTFQGEFATASFQAITTTSSSIPLTLTPSVIPSHPFSTYSIAAKAADSLSTQCVSNLSSLCSPFSMSPGLSLTSASSPAMGSTLTKVLPVSSEDSSVCSASSSVKFLAPSSNSVSCAASTEASSVSRKVSDFDKSAESDFSVANTYDSEPRPQPLGKSGMRLSPQKSSLSNTVKSELDSKDSSGQPVKSDESSCESLPDLDVIIRTPPVKSDGSESVSACKPSFSADSVCVLQPDVEKGVVGNHSDSQSSTSSDGSQLPDLSDIFKARKRKMSEEFDSDSEVMKSAVSTKGVQHETGIRLTSASAVSSVVKGTLQQAKSDPSEVQNWNVSEEEVSRKKKVLPLSSRKSMEHSSKVHHAGKSKKTWSSYHTEKCPPLSLGSLDQKSSFETGDEDIFEEEVLLDDHAESLPVIGPPKRKQPSLQDRDEKANNISPTPSYLSSYPVVKPPVFKTDHSVKYLGKSSILPPSTASITSTLVTSTNRTTSTLFPSSSTTSTLFPSINNTTSTLFPSTTSTSTLFPSTTSATCTPFPSTTSTKCTLFPSTTNTTTTIFPSTTSTNTLYPSTTSTTSTLFHSTTSTTSTLFPSTTGTTSTLFPSTTGTTSTSFPSTSSATGTLFSSSATSSTLFPSTTSILFPSTTSTTGTLFPSNNTSTLFPSATSTTSTFFSSITSTTGTLFPSNNTTSTLFPFTRTSSSILTPSSCSTTNVLSTCSPIYKISPSKSSFASSTGTSSSASKVFLSSNSASLPLFTASSGTSKASASASATSTFIPDPKVSLLKRMDSLGARIEGLMGTTDTLSVNYKSSDPFHIHSQAVPSSSSTFTAWRSPVKSQSDVPSVKMTSLHSTTGPITTTAEVVDSSFGVFGGKAKVSDGLTKYVSGAVTGTAFASWRGEEDTILGANTSDSSTVIGTSNTNFKSVNSLQAGLNTETNSDNSVSSTQAQSQAGSQEKITASTLSHNNAVSFAEKQHKLSGRASLFYHPQKLPALGRDLAKVEHNVNVRPSPFCHPQIVSAFGESGNSWPAHSSFSSVPSSASSQQPQVSQTSAPAMPAGDAGGKRVFKIPVVTLPNQEHLLDLAPIPSSSKGDKSEGGGAVLAPSKFGEDSAMGEHLAEPGGDDNIQPARLPPGPMDRVDETEAMVLDDSQDSVEIVALTPATVLDLSICGPSKRPASQSTANSVPPADVIDHEAPGPSGVDTTASQGQPERYLGLDFGIKKVLEVFPGIDRAHVSQLLESFLAGHTLDEALNHTMGALLDNPHPVTHLDDPHHQEREITVVHMQSSSSMPSGPDYYTNYSELSPVPFGVVADRLSMEFRNVRMDTINAVLKHYNNHYAPAHRCLSRALHTAVQELEKNKATRHYTRPLMIKVIFNEGEASEKTMQAWLMKSLRQFVSARLHEKDKKLAEEVEFVARRSQLDKEEMDRKVAWELLESEYEKEGQAIECGCCFAEHPFENLVQCFEGHLFCCQCLLGYAREAIFGSGKLHLACMTENCDSTFPKSQLLKALPDDVVGKYEERMAEENLNKAAMPDLVRCPSCNLAAVLDQNIQNFKCPNASCRKETCRDCKEDWAEHKGKKCHQLEKKDETKLRTNYEEKMTAARVRRCPSCHAQFFKEEGCNKMTCRCGASMCYICRAPQISYKHFCRHPRDPGLGCTKCKCCSLWTNPDEDEQRAIAEIQKEAQEKRKEHGFLDDKVIGVPEKRQRTK